LKLSLRILLYRPELPRLLRLGRRRSDLSAQASLFLIILLATSSLADTDIHSLPALSADAIVQKLMAANAERSLALRGYRGKRAYHLDYQGLWGSHQAGLQVEATYAAPDKKTFQVLAQSGSTLLVNRVLFKLLSSEQEAQTQQNREELEISPKNYDFALIGTDNTSGEDFYVLKVIPKGKSRYLYRGKMWVDAKDFAVARMEGEPAKNPSIWVSHTDIKYRWTKIDGFWLPARNESETLVRFGGKAVLTIDYSDYQITSVARSNSRSPGGTPTLPNPSAVTPDPH
jgi:hypothetical protein